MGQRVLIVEDEIVVALFMEDMLTAFGYEVAGVISRVEDALARDTDFAMAVLDVHLNGRNVFDFADKLAACGTPFVFATGYGMRGIPERFAARPVLQKPFVPDDLRRALAAIGGETPVRPAMPL